METLAEQYRNLSRRNTALRKGQKTLRTGLIGFALLFLLAVTYLIYVEFFTPFYGRWPQVQQNFQIVKQENKQLKEEIDSLQRVNGMLLELSPYYTGVFFEVQIGSFQYFDLDQYKEDLVKMNIDKTGEVDNYTLGKFRDLDKAFAFQRDIQRLGIKDAFVIAKIDGERVSVKRALEEQRRLNAAP